LKLLSYLVIFGEPLGEFLVFPLPCFFLGETADCCSSSTAITGESGRSQGGEITYRTSYTFYCKLVSTPRQHRTIGSKVREGPKAKEARQVRIRNRRLEEQDEGRGKDGTDVMHDTVRPDKSPKCNSIKMHVNIVCIGLNIMI
jgi:hypothetical protein